MQKLSVYLNETGFKNTLAGRRLLKIAKEYASNTNNVYIDEQEFADSRSISNFTIIDGEQFTITKLNFLQFVLFKMFEANFQNYYKYKGNKGIIKQEFINQYAVNYSDKYMQYFFENFHINKNLHYALNKKKTIKNIFDIEIFDYDLENETNPQNFKKYRNNFIIVKYITLFEKYILNIMNKMKIAY